MIKMAKEPRKTRIYSRSPREFAIEARCARTKTTYTFSQTFVARPYVLYSGRRVGNFESRDFSESTRV